MKFSAGLDPLLGSPTKLRLLRTLLPVPNRRWTGRELAAAARVSTAQAARDLSDFLDVGVVLRDVQGKAYSWRVNGQHVLVPELSRLLDFEAHLREILVRDVGKLIINAPIRRAVLFGSVARGDERADSDVDLFIEVKDSRDRPSAMSALEKVRERVWDRYGNPVTALVYTEAEMRKPANPPLLDSIAREGLHVRAGEDNANGKS